MSWWSEQSLPVKAGVIIVSGLIVLCLLLAVSIGDEGIEAEPPPAALEATPADRVTLYEDPLTGCQYLVFTTSTGASGGVSVIPRIRPDAAGFVCDGERLAEWQGEQD